MTTEEKIQALRMAGDMLEARERGETWHCGCETCKRAKRIVDAVTLLVPAPTELFQ